MIEVCIILYLLNEVPIVIAYGWCVCKKLHNKRTLSILWLLFDKRIKISFESIIIMMMISMNFDVSKIVSDALNGESWIAF